MIAASYTWSNQDQQIWRQLYSRQTPLRSKQLIPEFSEGLRLLGFSADRIPDLDDVNQRLKKITGWQGVFVSGFAGPETFYTMLKEKKFPVGRFIREAKDLSYTPEPDVFHDLYGHIPFYTMKDYADFSEDFGRRAEAYLYSSQITEEFQRLFWFAIEFGLVKTKEGLRIFGGGIASSFDECAYALSDKSKKIPFNLKAIREKSFRIDVMQDELFVLDNVNQLYQCLDDFEKDCW